MAVDEYRTDDEQLDALRRWWSENGKSLAVAVVTAVALSFGWQTWQASEEQNSGASVGHLSGPVA